MKCINEVSLDVQSWKHANSKEFKKLSGYVAYSNEVHIATPVHLV
jgi:hypothetical protein